MASVGLIFPAAHAAQTTTIYQVIAPSEVARGNENPLPVAVTAYYNNSVPGYRLVVAILDAESSPQKIVQGVVISSTAPCVNEPGSTAVCAITVPRSSGAVMIDFQIGGIFAGGTQQNSWNLNVTSVLEDPQNNLVPTSGSSKLLKVGLTPVALNANAPSNVVASTDYSVRAAVAFGIIAAAIIAFLLLQRRKRLTTSGEGPRLRKHSTSTLCPTNARISIVT